MEYPEIKELLHFPREREALAIEYLLLRKRGMEPRATHAVFQVDQNAGRMPGKFGCAPYIMPRDRFLYTHHGPDCVGGPKLLTPMEKCWLQGIGPEGQSALGLTYDVVAPALLADLAGNAFSANVVVALLFGLFANLRIQ